MNSKLLNTIKYPTTLIVNAVNSLGVEIAESLLEQGGYVVLVDIINDGNIEFLEEKFGNDKLISFIDFSQLQFLEEDLRRLDYTFYLHHDYDQLDGEISSQHFLRESNYLDTVLSLNVRFNAKFALTTAIKASYQSMADFHDPSALSKPNYTLGSVQQYAESLTLEYVDKAGLDARVARIGEMIGDGMDISRPTHFNKLVVEAASAQRLSIPGDGLESEYYVHVLDAAYGAVKALFTEETLGKTFNVSYEMPITYLSIAYRLQEIEPQAKDMNFSKDLSRASGLKLKNLAPNLSKLGWHPRIDLDQAISESLIVAKSALMTGVLNGQVGDGMIGKLRSFLNIANSPEEPVEADSQGGPVDRLIAERHQNLRERSSAMHRADDYLRQKRKHRDIPVGERLQNFIWSRFQGLQNNFAIISEITPTQFVLLIFGLVVFGWAYFNLLSPILVLGRNTIIIREAVGNLDQQLTNGNLQQVENQTALVRKSVEQNSMMIEKLTGVANLVSAGQTMNSLSEVNSVYAEVLSGVDDLAYGSQPFLDYLDIYISNIRFRVSSDSLLATGTSDDYQNILNQIDQRNAFLRSGLESLRNSKRALGKLEGIKIPNVALQAEFDTLNQRIDSAVDKFIALGSMSQFASEILGSQQPQTYVILLLDNARISPAGGQIVAYIEISVADGAITEIVANSVDSVTGQVDLPDYATEIIEFNDSQNLGNQTINDLSLIDDKEILYYTTANIWKESLSGGDISGVMLVTLPALEGFIQHAGEVVIEGEQFNNTDLLSKINSLGLSNAARNDLIAKISALTFDGLLQNLNQNIVPVNATLQELLAKEELIFLSPDLEFNSQVQLFDLDGDAAQQADSWIDVSLVNDVRTISETYPGMEQSLQLTINDDGSINHEMGLSFGSLNGLKDIIICLPSRAKSIALANYADTEFDIKSFVNRTCIRANTQARTSLVVSWQLEIVDGLQNQQYNVKLGIGKPTGINLTTALEVRTSPGVSITEVSPTQVAIIDGAFGFRDQISKDKIINITLEK